MAKNYGHKAKTRKSFGNDNRERCKDNLLNKMKSDENVVIYCKIDYDSDSLENDQT